MKIKYGFCLCQIWHSSENTSILFFDIISSHLRSDADWLTTLMTSLMTSSIAHYFIYINNIILKTVFVNLFLKITNQIHIFLYVKKKKLMSYK